MGELPCGCGGIFTCIDHVIEHFERDPEFRRQMDEARNELRTGAARNWAVFDQVADSKAT